MPKTKNNFARVTLWTEHIKLQTEGHTVAVVTQIFDHLTLGQKQAVFKNLNLAQAESRTLPAVQHHLALQFLKRGDATLFETQMKSLFLLQALSVTDMLSAQRVFSAPSTDIIETLKKSIHRHAVQLAVMSIGIPIQSDCFLPQTSYFSESESALLVSAINHIKEALNMNEDEVAVTA